MLNALRLTEGVDADLFADRTGLSSAVIRVKLRQAIDRGLLVDDPLVLRPTPLGRNFLNDLLEIFLPDEPDREAGTGEEGSRRDPASREHVRKPVPAGRTYGTRRHGRYRFAWSVWRVMQRRRRPEDKRNMALHCRMVLCR